MGIVTVVPGRAVVDPGNDTRTAAPDGRAPDFGEVNTDITAGRPNRSIRSCSVLLAALAGLEPTTKATTASANAQK